MVVMFGNLCDRIVGENGVVGEKSSHGNDEVTTGSRTFSRDGKSLYDRIHGGRSEERISV